MLSDHISSLLSSGEYSDLTIECQGQSFKVHRAIVCFQSPVIKAALHEQPEKTRSIFRIDDFDADTVQRMLQFMYGVQRSPSIKDGLKPDQEPNNKNSDHNKPSSEEIFLPLHEEKKKKVTSHVYASAIAHRYGVPEMSELVHEEIANFFQSEWSADFFLAATKVALSPRANKNKKMLLLLVQISVQHVEDLVIYGSDLAELMTDNELAVQFISASAERVLELQQAAAELKRNQRPRPKKPMIF